MNKEHPLMIPPVDLIRKICLLAPFLRSYPDVVIACIEYKVFWKHSEQRGMLV